MAEIIAPKNRERNSEILRLYGEGLSYGAIAVRMGVSRNVIAGVVSRSNAACRGGCRSPVTDLTGKVIGRLSVLRRVQNSPAGSARYLCECECGNRKIVLGSNLHGNTQSCGCLQKERVREAHLARRQRRLSGAAA